MLTCVIVDDEPLAVRMLENYVQRTGFLELVGSWNDPVEALSRIKDLRPQLVFLDIQMPDLDGLELSRMIPDGTRVVFTTAFKEYAFDSYEVSALDFLLKPIRYQKFLSAAQKAREWFEMRSATRVEGSIFLKSNGSIQSVELSDILYLEGMKDYVMVHLASAADPLVVHMTMKSAEDMLPSANFMRVHRSYIVALDKVSSFSQGDIVVGDAAIHVSEGYIERFNTYLKTKMMNR